MSPPTPPNPLPQTAAQHSPNLQPPPAPLPPRPARRAHPALRGLWITAGIILTGVGFVGLIVPGLPSTVFFILAAGAFSRGSERMYQWLVSLPHVGPAVRDYYAGLGMPRSAKLWATGLMFVCVSLGAFAIPHAWQIALAFAATGVGAFYIWFVVPTRTDRP
jgi:uncharacterized membrane protein YbaN (DUF454 family)